MKRMINLFLLSLLVNYLSAQDELFFLGLDSVWYSDVIEYEDSYTLLGTYENYLIPNNPPNHRFHSLSHEGDSLDSWFQNYQNTYSRMILDRVDDFTFGTSFIPGAFYIDSEANITRYNEDFTDTLLYRNYDEGGLLDFIKAVQISDSSFAVLGRSYDDTLDVHFSSLLMIDTLGNILSRENYYSEEVNFYPRDLVLTANDEILLMCSEWSFEAMNVYQRNYIINCDGEGVEESRDHIGELDFWSVSQGFIQTDEEIFLSYSNPFFVGGASINPDATTFLAKLDNDGEIVLEESIGSIGFDTTGNVYQVSGGLGLEEDILLHGTRSDSSFLARIDASMFIEWERFYTHPDQDQNEGVYSLTAVNFAKKASDGGFYLLGWYESGEGGIFDNSVFKGLFMKVDEFGCLVPGCQLVDGIEELSMERVEIFPNPSSGLFTLRSNEIIEYISIFDSKGQRIRRLSLNSVEAQLDLSEFPAGLYFLESSFQNDNRSVQRVVLQ